MPQKLVPSRIKKEFKALTQQLVLDLSQSLKIVQESPSFVDCPNCFESGTLVEVPSGLREIQDFEPGDVVVDGSGGCRLVDKVFYRSGEFSFTSVKTHGNNIGIAATSNHKLKVFKNVGTAYNPILGEEVEKPIGEVKKGELISKAIRSLQAERREKVSVGWKINRRGPRKALPEVLELSDDFLFAIGLYIAEGVTSKGRVASYCLNQNEREIGEKVCSLWASIADLNYTPCDRPGTENLVFEMYSSYVADLLDRWCGHGASNKKIPEELYYKLDRQQTLALLFGIFVGDGHKEDQYNSITFSTTSRVLAYQVYSLLLSCGFSASILSSDAKVYADGVNHAPYYTVRYWPDERFMQRGTIRTEDRIYQVVKEVTSEEKHTSVYNLEVQKEHSYIANGFSVQNCVWDSINKKSSNIFDASFSTPVTIFTGTDQERTISPVSFTLGRCPVCFGEGQLFTKKEVCIPAMVNYVSSDRGGRYSDLPVGREGVNFMVVKTLACHYELLLNNNIFVVHGNVKCEKYQPPFLRGMGGEEAVCEMILQTTEAGSRTSGKMGGGDRLSRNEDPRRKIKGPSDLNILQKRLTGR